LYDLELGGIEEDITKQSSNMGRAKPQKMAEKPQPLPGNTLYQQAFYSLDGERAIGMSVGRIPWSAVEHYGRTYDFTESQMLALHYLIMKMDAANLQYLSSLHKKPKR
jgi:hypothetical protein